MQPTRLLSPALLPSVSPRPPVASPQLRPNFPRWKRGLDLACGLVALPVLGGATLVGAIVTSVTSPGPLLFQTSVQGENGRCFRMYCFRTVHLAPAGTGGVSAGSARPPYMAGGERLRRSGWIKLPQIINVLRGEMTIVGGQPITGVQSKTGSKSDTEPALRPGIIAAPGSATIPGRTSTALHHTLTGEILVIARSVVTGLAEMLGRGQLSQHTRRSRAVD